MAHEVTDVILTAKEHEVHYSLSIFSKKASLHVHERNRIGLIVKNRAGKSTFLKNISDQQAEK